jgi:YVTN family beta-propeller protein
MEKKISKLLENKYENLVQFNVVNTTPNPISVSLFNTSQSLSNIPTSPTYTNQSNTVFNSFGTPVGLTFFQDLATNTNTGEVYASFSSTYIQRYNSSGVLISTLNVVGSSQISILNYNSSNNKLYAYDNNGFVFVVDCATFTSTATIIVGMPNAFDSAFDSVNNSIYYTDGGTTIVGLDCTTNTVFFITSIYNCSFLDYNSNTNQLYIGTSIGTCIIYDITTSTFSPTIITFPTITRTVNYNPSNNSMYVGSQAVDNVYVIDCNTNTIISTINLGGVIPFLFAFDYTLNNFYISSFSTNVAVINCTSNSLISTIVNPSASIGISFDDLSNSVYFVSQGTNNIQQVTTIGITASPYYISGSANYNYFLNNLNNEPVEIQMIRLFVQNQEQLYNQVQLTKIDSNGNQIFLPDFPINQVDTMQEQGNIAEISLKDIVFDGRTYINQYQLNGNETISFEIYYTQLNLTSASATFPIFFKPKIQLKDYIKNELNL